MLVYISHPFINTGFTLLPPTLPRQDTLHRLCNFGSWKAVGLLLTLDTRVSCAAEDTEQEQWYLHRFRARSFPSRGDAPTSSSTLRDCGLGCKGRAGLPWRLDPAGRARWYSPQPQLFDGSRGSWGYMRTRHPQLPHNYDRRNWKKNTESISNLEIPKQRLFFSLPLKVVSGRCSRIQRQFNKLPATSESLGNISSNLKCIWTISLQFIAEALLKRGMNNSKCRFPCRVKVFSSRDD